MTRLNKYLALATGVSRREADDLIAAGKVTINEKPTRLGQRAEEGDVISVDGKVIASTFEHTYIAFNKPAGYVCSRKQQGDAPTIYSIIPKDLHHLKPVGRLDKDSSGIILLTNDGDFAHRMTHPSFHKTKTYEVELDHDLEPLHQQMISDHGINLEDGKSKLNLERMNDIDRTHWQVSMHEGRNRQIRRTFASVGYSIVKLYRTEFGPYSVDGIQPGTYQSIKK